MQHKKTFFLLHKRLIISNLLCYYFLEDGYVGGMILIFAQNSDKVRSIPVIQIEPNRSQPRTRFSKEELAGLSESIKENGILQPLTVRKVFASKFELIAGERRLRAAIMAGFKTVPCLIVDCDETQSAVFALLENLQRSDLGPFEEAEGIQRLIQGCGITQEVAAQKLGKKQSTIANKLRLLKLSKEERQRITEANLTERHARALLKLENKEQREIALSRIILKGLNVQKSEILIDSMITENTSKNVNAHRKIIIKDIRIFMNTINKAIDTMKLSGIDAERSQRETEEYIEYRVRIPKATMVKAVESA